MWQHGMSVHPEQASFMCRLLASEYVCPHTHTRFKQLEPAEIPSIGIQCHTHGRSGPIIASLGCSTLACTSAEAHSIPSTLSMLHPCRQLSL